MVKISMYVCTRMYVCMYVYTCTPMFAHKAKEVVCDDRRGVGHPVGNGSVSQEGLERMSQKDVR